MTFGDTVQLALRNLGQAKLRTSLTTMGVSIGIASLAGMVSLGVGLQDQVVGRLTKSGVFDAITVTAQQRTAVMFGRGGGGGGRRITIGGQRGGRGNRDAAPASSSASDKPVPPLDDDAIATIAALPGVKYVYPNIFIPVEVRYDQFAEGTVVNGVPMAMKDEGAFQTMSFGGFFRNDTDNACLLSLDMAKRINDTDPGALIGQDLTLSYATAVAGGQPQRVDVKFTVVGIVERQQAGIGSGGISGLMIPLSKAMDINLTAVTRPQTLLLAPPDPLEALGRKTYPAVTVKVAHAQATQDVEDKIKAMGFGAFSLNDMLKAAKTIFIIIDLVLSLIGSIALAVSSLGIVNTMVMSILERTREIGIMKAIGGSDGDIRRIFLIEASTIGLLGGVVGVVLGWVVGRIINFGANYYIRSQGGDPGNLFSLPLWLIASAIGFSIAVSLIAGSYPASRAAKLDPIQALRHD